MKFCAGLLLILSSISYGDSLGKALDCYNAGNYQCSFSEYNTLSEQGYSSAQYSLGLLYEDGLGVKQNYFEAPQPCDVDLEQMTNSSSNQLQWLRRH